MGARLPSEVMSSSDGRWLITGGIGSGKSEVRRLLAERAFAPSDADAIGHAVLSDEGFAPVAERWPGVVLEGQIDRKTGSDRFRRHGRAQGAGSDHSSLDLRSDRGSWRVFRQ